MATPFCRTPVVAGGEIKERGQTVSTGRANEGKALTVHFGDEQ
jgi:hypothetical protein